MKDVETRALPVINARYKVVSLIGQGGMGTVFKTIDRLTGETVALKEVLTDTDQLTVHSRGTAVHNSH